MPGFSFLSLVVKLYIFKNDPPEKGLRSLSYILWPLWKAGFGCCFSENTAMSFNSEPIPQGVTRIGDMAFQGYPKLSAFPNMTTNLRFAGQGTILFCGIENPGKQATSPFAGSPSRYSHIRFRATWCELCRKGTCRVFLVCKVKAWRFTTKSPFAPYPLQTLQHYYGVIRHWHWHRYPTSYGPGSTWNTPLTFNDRFPCSISEPMYGASLLLHRMPKVQ